MRHRRKLTGCGMAAMLLALSLPSIASAQTDPDMTSKLLIAILVKKGVLSQSDADSILAQAQAAAAQASRQAQAAASPVAVPNPPPVSTVTVTSSETPDGTIHVTYIPPIVRDQITTAVTQQMTAQEQAQGYSGNSEVPDWVNHLHFSGDFRLRYEDDLFPRGNDDTGGLPNFNAINTGAPFDTSTGNANFPSELNANEDRDRFRLRARLSVVADLGDDFSLGFRLATGENDSPVSENQTLGNAPGGVQGGNFSKYAIWLDRAYLAYNATPLDDLNLTLKAGRFDNPFFSTNLIWADDLGFDGLVAQASYQVEPGLSPFLTAGAFPVYNTDFSFASNQPAKYPSHNKWLYAFQGGTKWKINEDYAAEFGIADYLFTNVAGKLSAPCVVNSSADQCSTDDDRPAFAQNGNTYMALRDIVPTTTNNNDTTLQYQYFGLASGFDELAVTGEFDINNLDPTDIWLNGEYVRNLAFNRTDISHKAVNNRGSLTASQPTGRFEGGNTGYFVYANIGTKVLQQRWDWNAMAGYKYVESDAVIDGLDDSDFGLGGTNLEGYIVGGNVALSSKVWVRLRYLSADSIVGPTYKADVFQFDLNGKF